MTILNARIISVLGNDHGRRARRDDDVARLHPESTSMIAAQVLSNLIEPCRMPSTRCCRYGLQFTHRPGTSTYSMHSFDHIYPAQDIKHRLTQPKHPSINDRIEPMNHTIIKQATVRTFHYASASSLKRHLDALLLAYNCARRLKTVKNKTSYKFIHEQWTKSPERFGLNPTSTT